MNKYKQIHIYNLYVFLFLLFFYDDNLFKNNESVKCLRIPHIFKFIISFLFLLFFQKYTILYNLSHF